MKIRELPLSIGSIVPLVESSVSDRTNRDGGGVAVRGDSCTLDRPEVLLMHGQACALFSLMSWHVCRHTCNEGTLPNVNRNEMGPALYVGRTGC